MTAPATGPSPASSRGTWKIALLIVLAILFAPVTIALLARSVVGDRG